MNCLYCKSKCQEPLIHNENLHTCKCIVCAVDYTFIDNKMSRIIFDVVKYNNMYYRMLLDLESNKTWLGINVDAGGLNFYKTVYDKKGLLNVTPQNVSDKVQTILVFS